MIRVNNLRHAFFVLFMTSCFTLESVRVFASEAKKAEPHNLHYQAEMRGHRALSITKQLDETHLNEFTTDGCSGGLTVGWKFLASSVESFRSVHGYSPPWESCCIEHDRRYHAAGGRLIDPEQSFALRSSADEELRTCVLSSGVNRTSLLSERYDMSADEIEELYIVISGLIYKAVRVGGIPCSGLPWRWGYGWPKCREKAEAE